jgi:hypothetical protein
MDGFDVRGLETGEVYDLPERVTEYLIRAGYAVQVSDDQRGSPKTPRGRNAGTTSTEPTRPKRSEQTRKSGR